MLAGKGALRAAACALVHSQLLSAFRQHLILQMTSSAWTWPPSAPQVGLTPYTNKAPGLNADYDTLPSAADVLLIPLTLIIIPP